MQSGFRSLYTRFTLRQMTAKLNKHNKEAYMRFVDMKKAFDREKQRRNIRKPRRKKGKPRINKSIMQNIYKRNRNNVRIENKDQKNSQQTRFKTRRNTKPGIHY